MKAFTKKPMRKMLIILAILFGAIFGYKAIKSMMITHFIKASGMPPVYVSTTHAALLPWQPQLKAAGNLRAIWGINVTTELAGMVRGIYFKPGAQVKKGDLLVQLDIDPDTAQLHSLQANQELAAITYKRDSGQYKIHAISKQTLDSDLANLKSTQAQVAQQIAEIAQKTIRAPFSGQVGICLVNPGQYVNPGDKVTMLQTYDPVYVDFYIPQASIADLHIGQAVNMTVDPFPNQVFSGKITTINPGLDPSVRNIEVEATIANSQKKLTPGMFSTVIVDVGTPVSRLTLPLTAISFNSYGEVVYLIKEKTSPKNKKNKKQEPLFTAEETFVVTGEKRGDQITIEKGIKEGDQVVTSGQLKLKNGSEIIINNTISPENNPAPSPTDE